MRFTDEHALKSRRSEFLSTAVGVFILMLAVAGIIFGLVSASQKIKNADSLANIMQNYEKPAEKVGYIDLAYEMGSFAYEKDTYTGKYCYYFAIDAEDYFYVVKARESAANKINAEVNANGTARVYGYTHEFNDHEIRKYALATLQEIFPDENITEADLYNILGPVELKVARMSPLSVMFENTILFGLIVIGLLLGGIIAASGALGFSKFVAIERQLPERIGMLENEMHGENSIWLPSLNMYAAENYIIAFKNGIDYVEYKDVLMIYKTVHKTNFVKTSESVSVLINNGTVHQIASVPVKVSLKGSSVDDEMAVLGAKAHEKNPDIFFGYDAQVLSDLMKRAKAGEFRR